MDSVWAVARAEVRRRWPALLALALLAGIGGATVASASALARRTDTVYDRLTEVTHPADVQVMVNAPRAADEVAALPGVAESWIVDVGVGAIGDQRIYTAIAAGAELPPEGLEQPLAVEGRLPDPDSTDEIAVERSVAQDFLDGPTGIGSTVPLTFLTANEYRSFDTGFGRPDGPQVDVRIVGTYQVAGVANAPPSIAGPGFLRAHPTALDAGQIVFIRLEDGAAGVAAFRAAAAELNSRLDVPVGGEEFSPLDVEVPSEARREVDTTADVLTAGLVAFAAIAGAVVLVLVGQALSRFHNATTSAQAVERALGLTASERIAARTIALVPTALLAAFLAVVGSAVVCGIEPIGSLRVFEPHPGRSFNPAVVVPVVLVLAGLVVLLAAIAALRASHDVVHPDRRLAHIPRWLTGVGSRPIGIGARLALARERAALPIRSATVGVAVGVIGVVGGLVFSASLDRLVDTPARYGWDGDGAIIDIDDQAADRVVADPDIAAATQYSESQVRVEDRIRVVSAYRDVKGSVAWWVIEGVRPTADDEIMLGPRLADTLDVGVGDEVNAGPARDLRVVGIGVGPVFGGSGFGNDALVTDGGLQRLGGTDPFTAMALRIRDGADLEEVVVRYGQHYEITGATVPQDVSNLSELGRLPELLSAFLALVGIAALGNALFVAVRRRRRDLAVLRVIGYRPKQSRRTVLIMGLTGSVLGLLIGIPLGLAAGRWIWRQVAEDASVAGDALVPGGLVVAVAVAVLVATLVLAGVPAWWASRRAPGPALRAE